MIKRLPRSFMNFDIEQFSYWRCASDGLVALRYSWCKPSTLNDSPGIAVSDLVGHNAPTWPNRLRRTPISTSSPPKMQFTSRISFAILVVSDHGLPTSTTSCVMAPYMSKPSSKNEHVYSCLGPTSYGRDISTSESST